MEELVAELRRMDHVYNANHEGPAPIRGFQEVSVGLRISHSADRLKRVAEQHGFSAVDAEYAFARKGIEVTDKHERAFSIGFMFQSQILPGQAREATLIVPNQMTPMLRRRVVAFFRSLHDPSKRTLGLVD